MQIMHSRLLTTGSRRILAMCGEVNGETQCQGKSARLTFTSTLEILLLKTSIIQ